MSDNATSIEQQNKKLNYEKTIHRENKFCFKEFRISMELENIYGLKIILWPAQHHLRRVLLGSDTCTCTSKNLLA